MFEAFKKYKADLEGVDVIKSDKKSSANTITRNTEQTSESSNPSIESNIPLKKSSIIFKVQLETSDKKLSLNSQKFAGIKVEEEKEGNVYKYVAGNFENDFESANLLKNEMRKKGFSNAFVYVLENGIRIPLDQGISKLKKK